jgi:hypothetical protein
MTSWKSAVVGVLVVIGAVGVYSTVCRRSEPEAPERQAIRERGPVVQLGCDESRAPARRTCAP